MLLEKRHRMEFAALHRACAANRNKPGFRKRMRRRLDIAHEMSIAAYDMLCHKEAFGKLGMFEKAHRKLLRRIIYGAKNPISRPDQIKLSLKRVLRKMATDMEYSRTEGAEYVARLLAEQKYHQKTAALAHKDAWTAAIERNGRRASLFRPQRLPKAPRRGLEAR